MARPFVANRAGEMPVSQHDECLNAVIDVILDNTDTCRDLVEALGNGDGPITPERMEKARAVLRRHDAQVEKIVIADELKKRAKRLGIRHEVARAAYASTLDETNKVVDLYEPGIPYRGSLMFIRLREDGSTGPEITAELYDLEPDSPRGADVRVYATSKPGDAAWDELCKVANTHRLVHAEIVFGDYWDQEDTWTRRITSFKEIGEQSLLGEVQVVDTGDPKTATHLAVEVPEAHYWENVEHNKLVEQIASRCGPRALGNADEEGLCNGTLFTEIPESLRGFEINCWPSGKHGYYAFFDREQPEGHLTIGCLFRRQVGEEPVKNTMWVHLETPNGGGPEATVNGDTGEVLRWYSDTRCDLPGDVVKAAAALGMKLGSAGPTGADSRIERQYMITKDEEERRLASTGQGQ